MQENQCCCYYHSPNIWKQIWSVLPLAVTEGEITCLQKSDFLVSGLLIWGFASRSRWTWCRVLQHKQFCLHVDMPLGDTGYLKGDHDLPCRRHSFIISVSGIKKKMASVPQIILLSNFFWVGVVGGDSACCECSWHAISSSSFTVLLHNLASVSAHAPCGSFGLTRKKLLIQMWYR